MDDAAPRHAERDIERMLAAVTGLHTAIGDLTPLLRRLVPAVLDTSTVVLSANGTAELQYRVPYQSVAIYSFAGAMLVVSSAPLAGGPPGPGPGSGLVHANGFALLNLAGYTLSLYGGVPTAGDQVTVSVFGQPQPPNAS